MRTSAASATGIYVSHAILQNRKAKAGRIARVPAPEIETLVRDGGRRLLGSMGEAEPPTATADRNLIEHHVARVIVKPQALDVCLIPNCEASAQAEDHGLDDLAPRHPTGPKEAGISIRPSPSRKCSRREAVAPFMSRAGA